MKQLGDTVYFNGDPLGTITGIKFAEGTHSLTLHEELSERTTALCITLHDGSSFFEPLRDPVKRRESIVELIWCRIRQAIGQKRVSSRSS